MVPANAEIVVEGDVIFGEDRVEGPFGEWTGYYASAERNEPIVKIKRLYHRNDPSSSARLREDLPPSSVGTGRICVPRLSGMRWKRPACPTSRASG